MIPPYRYGNVSRRRLAQCHPYLQRLFDEAIKYMDFIILEGHRDEETQNRYRAEGKSKVRWPHSRHNTYPSMAVDWAPYRQDREPHVDWQRLDQFGFAAGFLKGLWVALLERHQVHGTLRFGIDWDGDGDITDQTFMDYGHVELLLPQTRMAA